MEETLTLSLLIEVLQNVLKTHGDMPVWGDDFRDQGESSPTAAPLVLTLTKELIFGTVNYQRPGETPQDFYLDLDLPDSASGGEERLARWFALGLREAGSDVTTSIEDDDTGVAYELGRSLGRRILGLDPTNRTPGRSS